MAPTSMRLRIAGFSVALVFLLGAAGPATASHDLRPNVETTSASGNVTFAIGTDQIACSVTESKLVSRLISKTIGGLMGSGAMTTAGCRAIGGLGERVSVTWLSAYLLIYRGFTGALPAITGILLEVKGAAILVSIVSLAGLYRLQCLFRGEYENTMNVTARGRVEEITIAAGASIPYSRELFGNSVTCPNHLELSGVLTIEGSLTIELV